LLGPCSGHHTREGSKFILIKHISMLLCQIYFLLWEDMDRWDLSNVDILSTKEIKKKKIRIYNRKVVDGVWIKVAF
jgi:hypothetical protein